MLSSRVGEDLWAAFETTTEIDDPRPDSAD